MRASAISAAALLASGAYALDVDFTDASSISNATGTIVNHILSIYNGSGSTGIPGLFPDPYYWWESGLAWDSLINYWALTGDDSHNDVISQALLWQVGDNNNFLPANQTKSEGNDDQSTWALAAMTAAEKGFPAPSSDSGVDSWLQLAQNVFDSQAARWDQKTCGGGLRWQIYSFNTGYNYKNSMSNGNFAQLATRLARFTGNETYSDWAVKTVQWSIQAGLISRTGAVYDGLNTASSCQISRLQWTASLGTYISASAYAANLSSIMDHGSEANLLASTINPTFAPNNSILTESACAPNDNCNTDQLSFRAILARAMANDVNLAPNQPNSRICAALMNSTGCSSTGTVHQTVSNTLLSSAKGAAAQCSGGDDGTTCGSNWSSSTWDGTQGLGQDLSALEIMLANMPATTLATTNTTSNAGSGPSGSSSSSGSDSGSGSGTSGAATSAASMFGLLAAFVFAIFFCT